MFLKEMNTEMENWAKKSKFSYFCRIHTPSFQKTSNFSLNPVSIRQKIYLILYKYRKSILNNQSHVIELGNVQENIP